MAKQQVDKAAPGLLDVEELGAKRNTPYSVYRGVTAAEKWKPGKRVTEQEYDAAVQRFLGSPMGKGVKK